MGGFDRFGRIADQDWAMYSQSGGSLTKLADVDEYQYQYNRAGDRTARLNAVDAAMSELYSYNDLDELTAMARGQVSSGQNGNLQITDPAYSQSWDLDSLGNMSSVDDNGTPQTRQTNAANEITSTTGIATPAYDAAGNMTSDGTNSYQYDAWNRLVQVSDGSTILARYSYDAGNRRITELTNFDANAVPGTVTYYYFDGQNAIEVRTGAVTGGVIPAPTSLPVEYQYVYDGQGDKTPILRDSSFDANGNATTAGRIFYTADANTNVTAILGYNSTTQTWSVAERYVYAAYGEVTVYDSTWATQIGTSLSASTVGNSVGFASMVFDSVTGLYNDEARWYSTVTSTFITTDPIASTPNLYAYCGDGPTNGTDPSGEATNSTGTFAGAANSAEKHLGDFMVQLGPDHEKGGCYMDSEVQYLATKSDKAKYSKIDLKVQVTSVLVTYGYFSDSVTDSGWHTDVPTADVYTPYPKSIAGPRWDDNPGLRGWYTYNQISGPTYRCPPIGGLKEFKQAWIATAIGTRTVGGGTDNLGSVYWSHDCTASWSAISIPGYPGIICIPAVAQVFTPLSPTGKTFVTPETE